MKKLSLLLFAIFVSVMGWAASLNPYAYDLSSTWNEATSELTIRFKLNAHPNMTENNSGRGIQIHAVDPSDNNKMYYICGIPGAYINQKIADKSLDYEYTIPITGMTWDNKEVLPAGKNLTWAVTVQGLNNKDKTIPVVVDGGISDEYRPFSCHGIAINKDQNSKDFGAIYVTEASEGTDNGLWKWIKDQNKGRSLLKYTPRLDQVEAYRKYAADGTTPQDFSLRNGNNLLEPHKVRVSDDGRIFVSSYNRNTSNDKVVVWEFDKNTQQFKPIINHNTDYGHRVCAMDVKGSGNNLKILLCYFSENKKYNSTFQYAFAAYEYSITSSNTYPISTGAKRILYQPGMGSSLTDYSYGQGVLHWAKTVPSGSSTSNGYFYSDGFVNIAYGKTNNTDIFLMFDYYFSNVFTARTMYYKNCVPSSNSFFSGNPDYHTKDETNHYLGGAGFLTYKDENDSQEYLVAGRAVGILDNTESSGRVQVYPFDRNKSDDNISYSARWSPAVETKTKSVINDMAMDHANNIYAISFSDGTSNTPGTGRIVAIAMPYDGSTTTIAPSSNATENKYFNINPIPNILATDLRYEPVPNQPKYRFSFNVNTKPAVAQIRFYKSYGDNGDNDMKKNLAKINADDYQGGDAITPSFVYNIPNKFLKQGEIAVEFDMVGGEVVDGVLNDAALPRGEWYWSVYVEAPRKSNVFAPIYEQSTSGEDAHHRLHATVNNYPETDGFGHIYAVNYYAELDTRNGLMDYTINPDGNSNDEQNNIKNYNRYKLVKNYLNPTGNKPKFTNQRRLVVAPDGKVYIADCGQSLAFDAKADRPWMFKGGGVFVWNPNTQTGNEIQISIFSTKDRTSTATGIDIYNHNGQLKLYATNTYGEFENHYTLKHYWKGYEYTEPNQNNIERYGWNGFKEFNLGTPDNILLEETNGTVLHSLGMGDGNGNIGIVATDKGIWLAQHRLNDVQYTIDQFTAKPATKPALPDNTENYILSFVPYGNNTRTWTSCTTNGINYNGSQYDQKGASELTQLPSSPLQACPGAGLAYRKTTTGKEYLYIVNHEGNIVELQITSWDGTKPSVQYTKTYPGSGPKAVFQSTGRKQGVINTMCFDYAGNLITTSGLEYLGSASNQNIIVYTMPYNRKNAREIQAPKSCIRIAERLAYTEDAASVEPIINTYLPSGSKPGLCYVDIYRPMPNTSFSSICLPFDLDIQQIDNKELLYDAEFKQFANAMVKELGGENILELQFEDIPVVDGKQILKAYTPYIIKPQNRIAGIIEMGQPIQFVKIDPANLTTNSHDFDDDNDGINDNSITFTGVIPKQEIEVQEGKTLLLVAENRLAEMVSDKTVGGLPVGEIYGFRGYFTLEHALPQGMQAIISKKDKTVTGLIDVNGQKVNIQKYLREGRVYIRIGESLYTIDGQLVK